ncbi:MAG: DUF1549 and DUF1553 domain-containing protein, partial [Planctomycetota bacterium]
QNDTWSRTELDQFVLAKLQQSGLTPSPRADKRTLLRRLYFDLIGLPPTPAEVDAFLGDNSADAFSKVVDQLLDDRRYGERWARYWLDLARYADTAGYEGDPDLPQAWRYRDYVIDALNSDKPYDLFIKEQIAGDEFANVMGAGDLPGVPAEKLVAMTFLRLAPFTEPRGDETRHEMLSEMTSTVGSVFLGLTVGCAKCHDHKHDNIPTKDFYRMKAFFSTVQIPRPEPGDIYQIGGPIAAKFYRDGEPEAIRKKRQALERSLAESDAELAKLKREISERLGMEQSSTPGFGIQVFSGRGNDYFYEQRKVNDGNQHLSLIQSNGSRWTIASDEQITQSRAGELGSLAGRNRGKWFADVRQPRFISLGQHTAGSGHAQGAQHTGSFRDILIYDHALNQQEQYELREFSLGSNTEGVQPPQKGLVFWLDASDLDADPATNNPTLDSRVQGWKDRVAGIELRQADSNLQPKIILTEGGVAVRFDGSFLKSEFSQAPDFLKLKTGTIACVYDATHKDEGYAFEIGGENEFLSTFINPSAKPKQDSFEKLIDSDDSRITPSERNRYEHLSSRKRFVPQHLKRLQPSAMTLRHSYGPPYEPGVPVSRVMIRGEYDNPGAVVKAGFLSAITGSQEPAAIRLDPFQRWPTRSRRMALAQWIASRDNPMTARVMANRIWAWHFGQGIVRTPSDFGKLSGGPSHEELLDWLAQKFVESNWSIKSLHRVILNSATYQQSSTDAKPEGEKLDPENRLLWKFSRKRLDAEALRDSILFVSGRLNEASFGPPIFPPLPDDIADEVKYDNSKWDTQYDAEGRRRSLYIYQQRTLSMPFMQSFDALVCDESRPRRSQSITALQALAMMNGDLLAEEAVHFASRVRTKTKDSATDTQRQIRELFRIALARNPSPEELQVLFELAQSAKSPEVALISVSRVLLESNEFLFVD